MAALELRAGGEHVEEVVEEIRVVALADRGAHGLDLGARDLDAPRPSGGPRSRGRVLAEDRMQLVLEAAGLDRAVHPALLRRVGLPPPAPARVGSSGPIARVHGAQPIDV